MPDGNRIDFRAQAQQWQATLEVMDPADRLIHPPATDAVPSPEPLDVLELGRSFSECARDLAACRKGDDRQLGLGLDTPPAHRIRALAGVLAGFRWPDRGSLDALTNPQKKAALAAAEEALERLAGTA